MVFRKGGILSRNLRFIFDNSVLEILKTFTYLGVVFVTVYLVHPSPVS